jgi:hypothetical protein
MVMRLRRSLSVVHLLAAATLVAGAGAAVATPGPRDPGSGSGSHRQHWTVVPGVTYSQWHFLTPSGSPERVHVLDVNPSRPGISLGYDANATLRDRAPVSRTLATDPAAVAGVNGDYFDIQDTGAPLGIGKSASRGLLHATASGWNNAFYEDSDGRYRVGTLDLSAHLVQQPTWRISGLNTPHTQPNSITLYTRVWGRTVGRRVVDDKKAVVREAHVEGGVVVHNSTRLLADQRFHGELLLGRGTGARELKTLPVGSPVTARWSLVQQPRMAITGSQVLVNNGRVVAHSDGQAAPRTSVGVDTGNGHVLVVAVDGRQSRARGMSLPAFAGLLRSLGVDDAVNLDGGGSTTMVARKAGTMRVVNSPSLGHQRPVADTLAVDYTPPS